MLFEENNPNNPDLTLLTFSIIQVSFTLNAYKRGAADTSKHTARVQQKTSKLFGEYVQRLQETLTSNHELVCNL